MYRLTVMYPPAADPARFREYYTRVHLALTAKLPGLRAVRYSLDVQTAQGTDPLAAIWHGDFDSPETMAAALESAEGRAVVADLENFAPQGIRIIHYAPAAYAGDIGN